MTLCSEILHEQIVPIRKFASLIGLIVHAFNAIFVGPLHYRNLERDKIKSLKNSIDYESEMVISENSVQEITWWLHNIEKLNGKLIRNPSVDYWVETDASLQGWGASFEDKSTGGRWSVLESKMHINELELRAIQFAVRALFASYSNCHIGIKSDNTTAVAYINSIGGMTSESLDSVAIQIWNWCLDKNIIISAKHIPGVENVKADFLSRQFSDSKEWMLKSDIFIRICHHFFFPDIDLFASRLNAQLSNFISWVYDPDAADTDAFSLNWTNLKPYIFPPFRLIGKIINKIISDKVEEAIVIIPLWRTQSWFPMLISSLISVPARLPRHKDLLIMPHTGEFHPMGNSSIPGI
ncbi:uncharacterized protein LOC134232143 [Saccostrea cucullata]|uniref:uncharacterized protein LOC134232143 n=1 Tax=Saccostrea cuccullata TaxID=36930 RepID=UPI002ED1D6EB